MSYKIFDNSARFSYYKPHERTRVVAVFYRQHTGDEASKYVYQLTDHLGNVRAVIKKPNSNNLEILGATDYYPFGMPMPNRHIQDANAYRYAYQGQEKDPETGKEAFKLRLWDGRIGRWLTTDPKGQYTSPYLGMGNNPLSTIDPDGAFGSRLSAWLYKVFNGTGGEIFKNNYGTWGIDVSDGTYEGGVSIITASKSSPFYTASGNAWNNNFTRAFTGDAFSIGGGYAANVFLGADISIECTWVLRGRDASFIPNITIGPALTIGDGAEITASVFFSKKFYNGSVNQINAKDLGGYSVFVETGLTPGIGGQAGVDVSLNSNMRPTWISLYGGASAGAEASPFTAVNIKGGVRNDVLLFHSNGNIYINNPLNPSENIVIGKN